LIAVISTVLSDVAARRSRSARSSSDGVSCWCCCCSWWVRDVELTLHLPWNAMEFETRAVNKFWTKQALWLTTASSIVQFSSVQLLFASTVYIVEQSKHKRVHSKCLLSIPDFYFLNVSCLLATSWLDCTVYFLVSILNPAHGKSSVLLSNEHIKKKQKKRW